MPLVFGACNKLMNQKNSYNIQNFPRFLSNIRTNLLSHGTAKGSFLPAHWLHPGPGKKDKHGEMFGLNTIEFRNMVPSLNNENLNAEYAAKRANLANRQRHHLDVDHYGQKIFNKLEDRESLLTDTYDYYERMVNRGQDDFSHYDKRVHSPGKRQLDRDGAHWASIAEPIHYRTKEREYADSVTEYLQRDKNPCILDIFFPGKVQFDTSINFILNSNARN